MDNKVSNKISYMYYIMSIMILLLHCVDTNFFEVNKYVENINYAIRIICNISVSTFFFLSAILFYRNVENRNYFETIVSKIKTLIIPYLLWNLICFPLKEIKSFLHTKSFDLASINNIIYNVLISKYNPVLWFIRVLFIMILLYPILFKIIKSKKVFWIVVSLNLFLNIVIGPTIGYSTVRYWLPIYMLGGYLSFWYKDYIFLAQKKKFFWYFIILILQVLLVYFATKSETMLYICRIFSPILYWRLADIFLIERKPLWHEKQTFFYFCSQIIFANIIEKIYIKIFGNGNISAILANIIIPLTLLIFLILLAKAIYRVFPKVWDVLTGGRNVGRKNKNEKMKICLVGSSGGHLTHLYMLKPFWNNKERFWVTFDKVDANSILKNEKKYNCFFPTNRNIKNLIKNTFLAIKILKKEKPDVIISSGAAVAVPFFYIGKIMGAKLIYIEVFDRIDKSTITGKLVYPITDKFIVQWNEMKKVYPKAINLGSIF